MLSAGERPQPPINTNAVVDASRTPVTKVSLNHNSANSANSMRSETSKAENLQHIWVVTGPAGCGKTTVGRMLEKELRLPFLEGDDFHSQKNKEKMASGNALTDEDRWDWLISLRKAAIDALSPSQANNFQPPSGVVVACSALKQKYRDVMRVAAYGSPSVQIHFIYLKLDRDTLIERITKRDPSHYMKSGMVQSQLQALEEPQEEWDALTVNADGPREEVQRMVLQRVSEKLAEYQ